MAKTADKSTIFEQRRDFKANDHGQDRACKAQTRIAGRSPGAKRTASLAEISGDEGARKYSDGVLGRQADASANAVPSMPRRRVAMGRHAHVLPLRARRRCRRYEIDVKGCAAACDVSESRAVPEPRGRGRWRVDRRSAQRGRPSGVGGRGRFGAYAARVLGPRALEAALILTTPCGHRHEAGRETMVEPAATRVEPIEPKVPRGADGHPSAVSSRTAV